MGNNKFENKKSKLLLHSCCGPCSTSVILRLINEYDITVFFSNSNIDTNIEFDKRLKTQEEVIKHYKGNNFDLNFVFDEYNHFEYLEQIKGLEKELEGKKRCEKCIEYRLDRAASYAKEKDYEYFTTTLSVSPHKNSKLINSLGDELAKKYNVKFLESDFKKKDGFLISTKMSKQLNLYRQNYCGCEFAKLHLNIV